MTGARGGHFLQRCRLTWAGLAVLLAAALGLAQPWPAPVAHAATFTVNSTLDEHDQAPGDGACLSSPSSRCTLRAAIEEGNALAGFDTVGVPAGTYTLALGQLQTTSDISIQGAGPGSTIVQAGPQAYGGASRVFRLGVDGVDGQTRRAVLGRLTIRNGAAASGGGVSVGFTTQALLEQVVITGNHAETSGGGVLNAGDLTLRDAVIANNRAPGSTTAGGFSRGGGVRCVAPEEVSVPQVKLRIERASVVANVAFSGGGIHANDCNVTVVASTISGNTATSRDGGGGLYLDELGVHELTNVTISGNATTGVSSTGHSGGGGGLSYRGDDNNYGGPDSTLSLDHVTFFDNTSPVKTSGHNLVTTRPARTTIRNTILVHARTFGTNCSAVSAPLGTPLASRGGNIEFPGASCFVVPAPSSVTPDLTDSDPKLLPLANNGGPTMTHAPAGISRAIDRIAPSAGACPTTDQRGQPRPRDGNGDGIARCDSGAFEAQSPPVGTFVLAPAEASVAAGQRHVATLTWTVPAPETWHTLRTVHVRLREEGRDGGSDAAHTALQFDWDQGTNTVREVDPMTGRVGPGAALGSDMALESARAALNLEDSGIKGGGPTAPDVEFTMSLELKPPTKGRTYLVEVAATSDAGVSQGFAVAGAIEVGR